MKLKELFEYVSTHDLLFYFKRKDGSKNLKYPHVLEPAFPNDPNSKFCAFKFDSTTSRKGLMLTVLIGALLLVLFPIWPFTVKYAIWLISLVLLIAIVSLILVRYAVYLVSVAAGFRVWIFPNLFGDNGVWESFVPVVEATRWERGRWKMAIRIGVLILLVLYGARMYLDPTFLEGT
jgi:hypothetical protein